MPFLLNKLGLGIMEKLKEYSSFSKALYFKHFFITLNVKEAAVLNQIPLKLK